MTYAVCLSLCHSHTPASVKIDWSLMNALAVVLNPSFQWWKLLLLPQKLWLSLGGCRVLRIGKWQGKVIILWCRILFLAPVSFESYLNNNTQRQSKDGDAIKCATLIFVHSFFRLIKGSLVFTQSNTCSTTEWTKAWPRDNDGWWIGVKSWRSSWLIIPECQKASLNSLLQTCWNLWALIVLK